MAHSSQPLTCLPLHERYRGKDLGTPVAGQEFQAAKWKGEDIFFAFEGTVERE